MTILQALTLYSGRMSRSQFWNKGVAPMFFATIIPFGVLAVLYGPPLLITGWSAAFTIGLLWFQLPLWIKRAHDRNHSAWFLLITLIPVVGWGWMLVELGFVRGTNGVNRFGDDPTTLEREQQDAAGIPAAKRKSLWLAIVGSLAGLSVAVFLGMYPSLCMRFADFGAPLPGFTQLSFNTALLFGRSDIGLHVGGLLVGGWFWSCWRSYAQVSYAAPNKWPTRLLWFSVAGGLLLMAFLGFSLYLPYARMNMIVMP